MMLALAPIILPLDPLSFSVAFCVLKATRRLRPRERHSSVDSEGHEFLRIRVESRRAESGFTTCGL